MPADPKARWRVRLAFLSLFVFIVVLSIGAWYLTDLGRLQDRRAARESQASLQGVTEPAQIDAALRQHPSDRFLQMLATAMRAADNTGAAAAKLSNEVEQPPIPAGINLAAASRGDIEALARNLKTAEANATAFMPRYAALLKAERDSVERSALALHVDSETLGKLLDVIDRRQAEMTAFTAKMMAARAGFYRAYQDLVAVIAGEAGSYKVADGQFIFQSPRTVDRYNAAAAATAAAASRVGELEQEGKRLATWQQAAWVAFANGK